MVRTFAAGFADGGVGMCWATIAQSEFDGTSQLAHVRCRSSLFGTELGDVPDDGQANG